jgi:hypothetical protein
MGELASVLALVGGISDSDIFKLISPPLKDRERAELTLRRYSMPSKIYSFNNYFYIYKSLVTLNYFLYT